MAFWTLSEQQQIKPIDKNNLGIFAQLQNEVEANDLQNYLGFEFYQELKRNTADYTTLLSGGTYVYNGYNYTFSGLKYVCSYLLYARYVVQSSFNDTFSGFVQHTGETFQRISSSELKNLENRHKETAGKYWEECLHYLYTLNLEWFPCKNKTNKIGWL